MATYKTKLLLITYILINLNILLPLSYSAVCDPEPTERAEATEKSRTYCIYTDLYALVVMSWVCLCKNLGFADE